MKISKTRRILLSSFIAILFSLLTFTFTTFAWFSDGVSSSDNIITVGNLDAEMYWTNDIESNDWHNIEDKKYNAVFTHDNYEPGYTELKYLKIVNTGSLSFKYDLSLLPIGKIGKLAEVVDVYYMSDVTSKVSTRGLLDSNNKGTIEKTLGKSLSGTKVLLPRNTYDGQHTTYETIVAIALKMQTTAGNEYQGQSIGDGFSIRLKATQYSYEEDSFDEEYDKEATWPDDVILSDDVTKVAVENVGNKVAKAVSMVSKKGDVSANIPAGVSLEPGTKELALSVTAVDESNANISFDETEAMLSMDVHIEGVAEDNEVVMEISLGAVLPKGLNLGNYRFYHVEDKTYQMRLLVENETPVHNSFKYDPQTGNVIVYLKSFSEIAAVADTENAWEGNIDYTWYDENAIEYIIANADQLAAFSKIVGGMADFTYFQQFIVDGELTNPSIREILNANEEPIKDEKGNVVYRDSFNGKTVKLIADINLGDSEEENNPNLIFYPIGYYFRNGDSTVKSFEGVFNGNGHKISNFYQNTWEIKGDYDGNYYSDAMGLFGYVVNGEIRNLHVDNFSSDGEFTPTGVIAAYAVNSTFENIAITNCNPRVYNTGNGGIVGIGGNSSDTKEKNMIFRNITVDNSNKISALWGSWDVACGGIMGMFRGYSTVTFENCHVAAQIDVYNDVCGNYQYYWYRYAGMMIGSLRGRNTTDEQGYTVPNLQDIKATDCTVHFGDWNNYYYCELVANSLASYTHDHQFSRLTEVDNVDIVNKTFTIGGKTESIPTSGRYNYVVVTGEDSTENATCYHFVNGEVWDHKEDGGEEIVDGQTVLKEDKQHIFLPFNQLFQGDGWGVKHVPIYNDGKTYFKGITILDREIADSKVKFEVKPTEDKKQYQFTNGVKVEIGNIFSAKKDLGYKIDNANVRVTVSPVEKDNKVTFDYNANTNDWTKGTLAINGTGLFEILITDYYYCVPTTFVVNVSDERIDKFETNFTNDYLYRVGNKNTVSLKSLFTAYDYVFVDNNTLAVQVETIEGNASGTFTSNTDDWKEGTIKFNNTGIVKVIIFDNYSEHFELKLEVVDAINTTTAASVKSNNVVLLNDCDFSTIEVSNGYTLYGNGFKMNAKNDIMYDALGVGFVTLKNGTLDNVQIICPNFSYAIIYSSQIKDSGNTAKPSDSSNNARGNVRSAVMADGNSKIINSYIHGGRAAVFLRSGNLLIDNSTISGGAATNIHAVSAQSLTLRDVTLIQKPFKANVNDISKTLMGFSGLFECDENGNSTPLILEGTLVQDAWINEEYNSYVPETAQSIVDTALKQEDFLHDLDGDGTKESLNLGFTFIPQNIGGSTNAKVTDNRTNKEIIPYAEVSVGNALASATVYSYRNTKGTSAEFTTVYEYVPTTQGSTSPTIVFTDANVDRVFETKFDPTDNRWESSLTVNLDNGNYTFSFANLLAQKHGENLTYTVKTEDGTEIDILKDISLTASGVTEYVLTITDGDGSTHTAYFILITSKTSIPEPIAYDTTGGTPLLVVKSKNSDWSCAIPALEGIKVKYYTANGEEILDLATLTPTSTGKQNGTNNSWEISKDGYKLKVTCGYIHDTKQVYGMPVVVNNGGNKLYFTISSTNGYVSTNTASRSVTLTYEFTDPNGKTLTFSKTWQFNYADYKNGTQYSYSDFVNGTLKEAGSGTCVSEGTLITLANGTKVPVEQLKGDELLLVWNHTTGRMDYAKIAYIVNHDEVRTEHEVMRMNFNDGTYINIIGEHVFYDATLNKYVAIDSNNYTDYIGHKLLKNNDNNNLVEIEFTSATINLELTRTFEVVTDKHLINFTNDILSTSAFLDPLLNVFDINPETYAYDIDQMMKDIEEYGLYAYEDFEGLIDEKAFELYNAAYLKVAVGKGYITWDDIIELINIYYDVEVKPLI